MTSLPLNIAILGADDAAAAREFYAAVLALRVQDYGTFSRLELYGTGDLGITDASALAAESGVSAEGSGFGGYIVSCVMEQPGEVVAVVDAAAGAGAEILKPAKKALFGSFSGAFRAPDGAVWKVSCERKKDTAAAKSPAVPTETGILLGVEDPKASKTFYTALGMETDRDYGATYIDFTVTAGSLRLGLMRRRDLAKDVGLSPEGSGFGRLVLSHDAVSADEVEAVLSRAEQAGAEITVPPAAQEWGGHVGCFTDPDGMVWKIASA